MLYVHKALKLAIIKHTRVNNQWVVPLMSPTQYTLNVYNVHVLVHVLVPNKYLEEFKSNN